MAQTNYTPISLYYSTTAAAVPVNTNLVNGELAINITDGKLYYKNNSGVVTLLASSTATGGSFTSITDSGNLTFTGTGNRITGDFSNATVASRVEFQSSSTNGNTAVGAIPNGTATVSAFDVFNNSDTTNAGRGRLIISGSSFDIQSTITGTGTYLPMTFFTGGSERARIDTSGNVGIGTTAPGGSATDRQLTVLGTSAQVTASNATYTTVLGVSGANLSYVQATGATPNLTFVTGSTERMRIDSSGNVGVGTSTPSVKLDVVGTVQSTGVFSVNGTTTGTASKVWFGSDGGGGGFINVPTGYGLSIFQNNATILAKFDSAGNVGIGVTPSAWSTTLKPIEIGNIGTYIAGRPSGNQLDIGVNNYYNAGYKYANTGVAATQYEQTAGTHAWYYAASGTAGNAITFTQAMTLNASGSLGIGTTSLTGITLAVGKTITGAITSYGVLNNGTIQSDVTNAAIGYQTSLSTQAAAFTLTNLTHFAASQATIGATSVVTSQYGFVANSNLTGATNNYGFYGNIASGTSRYNLYMNGTADNYLAGNVGIGKNTPTTKLEVAGAVANALIRINRTDNAAARGALQWTGNDDVVDWQIGTNMVASGGLEFSTAAASGLLMTLDTTGNLGIGTSSPSTYGAKLAIYSDASSVANIQITNPGVGTGTIGIAAASSNFKIYNSYTSATLASGVGIDIDTAGNVGINNTNPSNKLDVIAGNDNGVRVQNTAGGIAINLGTTGGVAGFAGTTSNHPFVLFANNAERMRIDSSGNVGIGVTPTANFGPLQVYTSTNGTAAYLGNGAGVHAFNGVGFYSSAATLASSGVWTARSTGAGVVGASNAGTITFYTDTGLTSGSAFTPTTRMTIDGSGNVGIGISSSIAAPLQIYNATSALIQVDGDVSSSIRATRYSTDTNGAVYQARKSRGTFASPTAVASGDTAGTFQFTAYGGTNYRTVGSIQAFVDTYTSDTNISSYLTFGTNSGSTTVTEKMRIDSSGNVGIGTSSPRLATGYTSLCLNNATTGAFIDFSVAGTRQATITTSATVFDFQSALTSPITFSTNGANERMRLDSVGNLQVSTGAVMHYAPAPTSIAAATTLTNAQIQNQIINTTGTTYTVTMPLGTTLETLATWATTNISYDFYVINTASGTITIGANSNTTLGSLTIATGVSAQFRIRRTAANAFTIYRLG